MRFTALLISLSLVFAVVAPATPPFHPALDVLAQSVQLCVATSALSPPIRSCRSCSRLASASLLTSPQNAHLLDALSRCALHYGLLLARASFLPAASSQFLSCARALSPPAANAPAARSSNTQRRALCTLFLAQSIAGAARYRPLIFPLFSRALLDDDALAEAVDGMRQVTPDLLSLLPLLRSFPAASCHSGALLDVVLAFISSFQPSSLQEAMHSLLSLCASLPDLQTVAAQRGLLPSAAVYVIHAPALLERVLSFASLALPAPPSLLPPISQSNHPIHIAYMLPSLNPALLYFNLRDVFRSHARARVTYINTCDKEFPQDGKWGSPAAPPEHLSRSGVALRDACGRGQAAAEIAAFVNALAVHVLVDPMGWASGHRQDVLVYRPAALQFGAIFPAAHSSSYIQYNVLDARVSPPELSPRASAALTQPLLLPFYSPTQHAGTYSREERIGWEAAAEAAGHELLLDVWSAWWSVRGGVGADAARMMNATTASYGKAVDACDGVVMMAPAKGFKWDEELVLQWLRSAADVEGALQRKCGSRRRLLADVAASLQLRSYAVPPRVMLVFMNWTSIDASVRRLRSLAETHGLAKVISEHVVVLPRVAHANYMRRCGATRVWLDTRQHSGHSTSMDFLFALAVPIAIAGESVASRVSVSLLAGMCEQHAMARLVCGFVARNVEDYGHILRRSVRMASPKMRQLRGAAREGRESSLVFDTGAWAAYLETGAGMALDVGGGFIIVPARAALSNR